MFIDSKGYKMNMIEIIPIQFNTVSAVNTFLRTVLPSTVSAIKGKRPAKPIIPVKYVNNIT